MTKKQVIKLITTQLEKYLDDNKIHNPTEYSLDKMEKTDKKIGASEFAKRLITHL